VSGSAAQPRRLAILALLASAGEQGLTRDKVLAYLWPDTDTERARPVLNQALYALRQDLGSDDVFLGTRELRLNPELVSSDVADFEQALARGKLEDAAERYTGPFLDGFRLPGAAEFDRWVEEERADLARSYAESLGKLARQAEARADWLEAVEWWRRTAAQDPLNGRIALRLMQALVAAGDRSGALRHARIYESLVQQELDLPPDREVVAYAERLRSEPQPVAAPAAPTPTPSPASPPAPRVATQERLPGSLVKAVRSLKTEEVAKLRSTADWVELLKQSPAKAEARRSRWIAWLLIAAAIGLLLAGIAIVALRAG
jgi:DNA-binding SARP family transcriptional activator